MMMLLLSVAVAFLDQATKYLVRTNLSLEQRIEVIPGLFNLTYIRNDGAAWGIFAGQSFFLISLSIVMLAVLVIFRRQIIEDVLLQRLALSLMVAGIIGNLIDRVRLKYVVDFLDFYWAPTQSHFPSFNVADSAICIGVFLYMLSSVLEGRKKNEAEKPKAANE